MIVGFEDYKHNYDFSKVSGIIHVGAHEGQELDSYLESFGKDIYTHWFEPDPNVFEVLYRKVFDRPRTHIYNFALGSNAGTSKMWIDIKGNGESSSLMEPKKILEIYPHLEFIEGTTIHIKTLDEFEIKNSNVLVIDAQGFELEVLKGAQKTLTLIDHIFSEVNQEEMYEGCPTFDDIHTHLTNLGFSLKENYWTTGRWGDCYWSRL
jgi:FkbM family methyltransferase